MSLIIEQSFPLGRFHATRWNQNPFEDRHGEWPPSPWRLLRALAARWFQYTRETGDEDEVKRDQLLTRLASEVPAFDLPSMTWRGEPAPHQYHKTEVAWTDASAKAAAVRKPKTTLTVDHFRAVAPSEFGSSPERVARVLWIWDKLDLTSEQTTLLEQLLRRTLYFGRAESWCQLRVSTGPLPSSRCELSSLNKTGAPVLAVDPTKEFDIRRLLAPTDDALFKGRQIPPGTQWFYAEVPKPSATTRRPAKKPSYPTDIQLVQFAVGGRVYPDLTNWVRVTERFRGCVLKHAARIVTGGKSRTYGDLWCDDGEQSREDREKLKLLSGKDGDGRPLKDHQHAYFILCSDENGQPTRLIAWRRTPFAPFEIEALLAASNEEISWRFTRGESSLKDEWRLRLVPLPFQVSPPSGFAGPHEASRIWVSATPFVPPNRKRFRRTGRLRATESASQLLERGLKELLSLLKLDAIVSRIEMLCDGEWNSASTTGDPEPSDWVAIHETAAERRDRRLQGQRRIRPGFRFRVTFSKPICDPICVGHSSHFGLGQFVPENSSRVD